MSWDYAELSKMAKANGGPENFFNKIIESSKADGKNQLRPWVGIAFVGGIALTIGVKKVINYIFEKRKISESEVELAKQELIQGIREYDATQAISLEKESDNIEDDNN